jgi:hypothetical protein
MAWVEGRGSPDPLPSTSRIDQVEGDDVEAAGSKRERLDIYFHFPDGIPTLNVNLTPLSPPRPIATAAVLSIGEKKPMSTATITVDTTDGIASLSFEDDKGDTNAAAPAGLTAAFSSDNPAALTIANDATNPLQGDITVVGEGVANVGVSLTDANGNSPPLEADGVTPWAAIDPVAVTVDPGAAVGAQLSVTG